MRSSEFTSVSTFNPASYPSHIKTSYFTSDDSSLLPANHQSSPLKQPQSSPPSQSNPRSIYRRDTSLKRKTHHTILPTLFNWSPPQQVAMAHKFSKKTHQQLQNALAHSWTPSTFNKYSNSIQHFQTFCELEGVPNHLRFPANEFVLCAFAASGAGSSSFSTIRNKITAIKGWHDSHGAQWNGGPRLRLVLNGVKNLTPASSTRPPRPPINTTMLLQLIDGLDLSLPLDASIGACAAVAFWGQCRLGELLSVSPNLPTTLTTPSRQSLRRSRRKSHTLVLSLPRTKTKRHGDNVILTQQTKRLDPAHLLTNHLRTSRLPKHLPLFTYSSPSGPRQLTKHRFMLRCNAIWKSHGYPRITGHSFRIGGTTELLLAGVPPDVVKVLGRWSSNSFLRYWRFPEDIAPQYTQNLRTSRKRKHSDCTR